MRRDIDQWREGLRVVEQRVREGEAALKSNLDVVGPWPKPKPKLKLKPKPKPKPKLKILKVLKVLTPTYLPT
ncbi:hypothetical protein VTN02DRAFT_5880 [Thermoascus thermophilus]